MRVTALFDRYKPFLCGGALGKQGEVIAANPALVESY